MELQEAFEMAEELLRQHGLAGWRVELDSAKRRAGVCRFQDKVIGLSAPLTRLHEEGEVRDTVLHEIAHALVGPEHGHDQIWRREARRIGCSGHRCVSAEAPRVAGAWLGVCSAGHTRDRHRRPERVSSCGECAPGFSADHLLEWTYRGRPAAMHANYLAELDAIRAGRRVRRMGVGARARVTLAGEFHGLEGRIVKVGRTSYHLKIGGLGVLRVVFAGAEPAG